MDTSNLSAGQRQLLMLMQQVNFGRLENLHVRSGHPVFNPGPRVVHEVKFGAENGPRRELSADGFALKAQFVELFAHCEQLKNGVIECLVIKHGVPFSMNVETAD